MGGPGSGSSELSAEKSCHVNLSHCLEPQHYQHRQASKKGKKASKMPQYRPRKRGAAGGAFDDATINGEYHRPRRIRKR
jgi:hypothetical protein